MKSIIAALSLLFFINFCSFSQSDKPVRIEIEATPDNPSLELIPAGPKGLVLLNKAARKADKDKYLYQLAFYNQNLKKMWVKEISLITECEFNSYILNDSSIALLFIDNNKNNTVQYYITTVNIFSGLSRVSSGKLPEKSVISGFVNIGDHYFIASNGTKNQCSLIEKITNSDNNQDINILKIKTGTIYVIKPDRKSNKILAVISQDEGKNEDFYLFSYSVSSGQSFKAKIEPVEENKIFTGVRILPADSGKLIMAGTYVHKNEKVNSTKAEEQDNTGFFVSKFADSIMKCIHYYNFIDYKNFYNYISQEEMVKIRRKAEKKGIKESDFSLNYKLLLHDISLVNGNYLMAAEVFTPEYRTVTRTTVDFYGRPMPETYTVFDGYRLLNNLLFAFNDSCKCMWDNSFEIYDVLDFDLFSRLSMMTDSNNLVLAYNMEGKLVYKVIDGGKTIEGPEHIKVETGHNSDKINDEKKSHLVYWYDNFMLAYGYQQIKNHILPGRNTRTVFYINKIGYR